MSGVPQTLLQIALGAVLLVSAGLKLRAPARSIAALEPFGFAGGGISRLAFGCLVAAEAGLAVGVVAGSESAAMAAAALMAIFAFAMVGAILRGRAGAECACFGATSRIGWPAVGRNALLAAAFAAVPFVPDDGMSADAWLAVGLAVALVACAGLAVAVLGLAREVGMLRLRLGPESALEIDSEGPPLGSRTALGDRFEVGTRTELLLAVFLSDGCHVCRTVEPMVEGLAREPILSVAILDEVRDSGAWAELAVPGSPYAVAFDLDGTVLAKGSFNTLGQLESVLATAERRRGAPPSTLAEAIGV